MRTFLLTVACLAFSVFARAESFEIKDGDRVLFLGDTLLEREGSYGYLETRMVEQFPDHKFTVRNLAFSADTPLGWSRASFDPPAKGFERLNLYAFLMELGRPGPFDASKNNVARVWQLSESDAKSGVLPPAATTTTTIPAYTLEDGQLTKDLLAEKITVLAPKSATAFLTARFQAATTGKATLNLTGIRKAWLDGQPLAIVSEPSPSVDMSADAHTFTVEVDAKSPPEVLRVESPAVLFLGDWEWSAGVLAGHECQSAKRHFSCVHGRRGRQRSIMPALSPLARASLEHAHPARMSLRVAHRECLSRTDSRCRWHKARSRRGDFIRSTNVRHRWLH